MTTKEIKQIVPRGHWVLIVPVEKDSRETDQGLILPASEEQEQKARGVVEAVGDKVEDIKKGDEVVYGAFAGETMTRVENGEEKEYKVVLDEDIIAYLK